MFSSGVTKGNSKKDLQRTTRTLVIDDETVVCTQRLRWNRLLKNLGSDYSEVQFFSLE